jgi:hypothetical protein
MSVYSDFVLFVDGGSLVPYHLHGAKYFPAPVNVVEKFEYDFKIYMRTDSRCFVGVGFSSFVRVISTKDFELVKSKVFVEDASKKVQLSFIFD